MLNTIKSWCLLLFLVLLGLSNIGLSSCTCSTEISPGKDVAVFEGDHVLKISPYLFASPGEEIKIIVISKSNSPTYITDVLLKPEDAIITQWPEEVLLSETHSWPPTLPESEFGSLHNDQRTFKVKIPPDISLPVKLTIEMMSEHADPRGNTQYDIGHSGSTWEISLGELRNVALEDVFTVNDWQVYMDNAVGFSLKIDYSSRIDCYLDITDPENKIWNYASSQSSLLEQQKPDILAAGTSRAKVSFKHPESEVVKYNQGDVFTLAVRERYTGYLLHTEKLIYDKKNISVSGVDISWIYDSTSQRNIIDSIKIIVRNDGRWAVPLDDIYHIVKSKEHISAWEDVGLVRFLNKGETILESGTQRDFPVPEGEKNLYITLLYGISGLGGYKPFNDSSLQEYVLATWQQKLVEP